MCVWSTTYSYRKVQKRLFSMNARDARQKLCEVGVF